MDLQLLAINDLLIHQINVGVKTCPSHVLSLFVSQLQRDFPREIPLQIHILLVRNLSIISAKFVCTLLHTTCRWVTLYPAFCVEVYELNS